MGRTNAAAMFAGVMILAAGTAVLASPDELMPCKILSVKIDKADATLAHVKVMCKAGETAFALPNSVNSPTANGYGGSLQVRDLTSMMTIVHGASLGSSGWQGIGQPPGFKGYRYRGSLCQSVSVQPTRVKMKCRTHLPEGTLPVVGDVGVLLHFHGDGPSGGKSYCAQFGGAESRNDASALLRKNALAPTECMEP